MDKTAFVILKDDKYDPNTSPSIIGICSTKESR